MPHRLVHGESGRIATHLVCAGAPRAGPQFHVYCRRRNEGAAALVEALSTGGEDCWRMQLATLVSKYPRSEAESDAVMARDVAGMRAALTRAHVEVNAMLRESAVDDRNAGTTCTAVLFDGAEMHVSNVGDSRAVIGKATETDAKGVASKGAAHDLTIVISAQGCHGLVFSPDR